MMIIPLCDDMQMSLPVYQVYHLQSSDVLPDSGVSMNIGGGTSFCAGIRGDAGGFRRALPWSGDVIRITSGLHQMQYEHSIDAAVSQFTVFQAVHKRFCRFTSASADSRDPQKKQFNVM
jgi:hypothetical protein